MYADCLLKNISTKHSKYVVNKKLEHVDVSFREIFGRISVFFCFWLFVCLCIFFFVLLQNKTYPFLAQVCLLFKILILNILSERKSQELVFRPFKWNKKSLYRILCLYLKCFVVLSDKWWRLFFLVYRYINQTGSCLLKMALTLFKYIFVLISCIICLGEFSWSKFWAYKHHVLHQ